MDFTEKTIDNLPVFELAGKIMGDEKTLAFCDRLQACIDAGQKHVILDFSKVRWINSSAIGKMIQCVKTSRENGGDLHFVGVHGRVAFYLEVTRLDSQLKIYKDVAEAIRKLSPSDLVSPK